MPTKATKTTKATPAVRPLGVTVLGSMAYIAAFLAFVHVLQSLAILPFFVGPIIALKGFNLWSALMWALMVWVWIWVAQMLWRLDPQAWIFLTIITAFNLVLDFTYLVGVAQWSDISINFIFNGLILIYCLLPDVKKAFDVK